MQGPLRHSHHLTIHILELARKNGPENALDRQSSPNSDQDNCRNRHLAAPIDDGGSGRVPGNRGYHHQKTGHRWSSS